MKHNVIIRLGAAHWDARVRQPGHTHHGWIQFDFRKMERKERAAFHRELLNAFRAQRNAA